MNPPMNMNPQQPQQGWPSNNLNQQMSNLNIGGPPKPEMSPQNYLPQQQYTGFNNNQIPPPSGSTGSFNNNNQFPPTNGVQNGAGGHTMPVQMGSKIPPLTSSPHVYQSQTTLSQQGQRPPIPGEPATSSQQNGHGGQERPTTSLARPQNSAMAPFNQASSPTPNQSQPVSTPTQINNFPSPQSQQVSGILPQQGQPSQFQGMPGQVMLQQSSGMYGQPGLQQNQGLPPRPGQSASQQVAGMPSQLAQQNQNSSMPTQQVLPQQQRPVLPSMPGQQALNSSQNQNSGMPSQQASTLQQRPGSQQTVPPQQQQGMPTTKAPISHQYPGMPPLPGQQAPVLQHSGMAFSTGQPALNQQQGLPPMPFQQQQPPAMGQQYPPQTGMPGVLPQPGMPGMPPQYPPGSMQGRSNFNQQPGMYPGPGQQPGQFPAQQPGQFPGQQPSGYPSSPMQAAPQRRLDPDQMPNPIQVMAENQRNAGGVFSTLQVGQVPPLVTTNFVTQDQGNSGPRYVRSTMYNVPATTDMMKQSAVPFSLVVSPFAKTVEGEMAPPIVDFGEIGPIRCIRCKAYMSPYMQFIDAGRRFQCLLCKATTEVPPEYFQHLDHTGQRVDKYERPELVLGTYEFMATKDYCRNNVPPKPPAMIFIIDVSYNNVKSGLVHLMCSQIKNIIQNLPIDQGQTKSKVKVGFITYNNCVHFYNIKSTLTQPQMMVVGDVHEMFMPLLDGFLADPEESETVIDLLMDQIPKMYGDTRETETILLPAIQAGLEALKASECAGKLLVFHSSLPVCDAPGQLKNRDDRKLLGTEKEKTILTPQTTVYNNLGQECVNSGCSVDLYIFNNSYIDLATIGQVSRLTGGEVYKYTYFQSDIDGPRLISDVIKNISRPIAFDTVMRVRTSTGTRPTDFFGHFFMSNTTDMEIASIDCDKSVAIEIKHDDKLPPEENVYIQIALLYTSSSGQRRLRIMNLALKTCTQLADLFRSCDLDTTILFFAKQGITKLLEHTPKVFKDNLINRAAQILACYRKHCASPTSAGQLILPECLKLLPLYVSCLLKNDAFSGGSDLTVDDRSYAMYFVSSMDLPASVTYFYPRLIPIHNVDPESTEIPAPIRCTIDKMTDDGAYILDNGIYMFIYLGVGVSTEFIHSVFGVQSTQQVDTERVELPILENPLSKKVRAIVESIQAERTRCMRIALVRQRDKLEAVLRHFLIEDRGSNGSESYVDFLCFMHKEIRSLLS